MPLLYSGDHGRYCQEIVTLLRYVGDLEAAEEKLAERIELEVQPTQRAS